MGIYRTASFKFLMFISVIILCIVDTVTGHEISFSIFYLIPIMIGCWFFGRNTGIALSVLSAIAWFTADRLGYHDYSHNLIPYWNAVMRLWVFLIIVYATTELKKHLIMNRRLASIVESSEDAIIGVTPEGITTSWNRGAEKIYGYEREYMKGKSIALLSATDRDNNEMFTNFGKIVEGGLTETFEVEHRRSKGAGLTVSVMLSPIRDIQSRIVAVSAILRDITKRRELERMKEGFISTVSHELRTPLTSIREAIAQVLDGIHGETTEMQREFLGIALNEADRLRKIIHNILEVSKLESNMVKLQDKPVDVAEIAREVIKRLSIQVTKKGLKFEQNIPNEILEVCGDKDRITEIFENLLSNAIKFTDSGSIGIQIETRGEDIFCTIFDTGIGISENDLPLLFTKYQRFTLDGTSGKEGTGLGLVIAKEVVELHGGKIRVESEVNKGTRFIFNLPKKSAVQC